MLSIRHARISEAQAVVDLVKKTIRTINAHDYADAHIQAWIALQHPARVAKTIQAGHLLVCADDEERIWGMGSRVGEQIHGLYTAADKQRQGIGARLLARLEHDARVEGITTLTFLVTLTALSFYVRHGYTEIAREL